MDFLSLFKPTSSSGHTHWVKRHKTVGKRGTLLRLVVPTLLITMLFWVHNNDFPTNFASAEARQQWAYAEFSDCKSVVQEIRSFRWCL